MHHYQEKYLEKDGKLGGKTRVKGGKCVVK